jgi:hypothetical protein
MSTAVPEVHCGIFSRVRYFSADHFLGRGKEGVYSHRWTFEANLVAASVRTIFSDAGRRGSTLIDEPLSAPQRRGGFDCRPGVMILELCWAQVAEREMESAGVVDLIDKRGRSAVTSSKVS